MGLTAIWYGTLRKYGFKASDGLKIFLTLIHTFLAGAVLCYISSLPIALFLSHYGSKNLPKIYLIVAFISMGFGFALTYFEHKYTFNRVITGLSFILSMVLCLLAVGILVLNTPILIIILLVWCIMAYDLIEFCVWSVINRIYTIQQAKNSFGIIGGMQSIGGMFAGFLSPLFVALLGINIFLIFIGGLALFMLLTTFFLFKISTETKDKANEPDEVLDAPLDEPSLKWVFANPYIIKIFTLSALSIFALYTVDLAFNTASEAHYPNEKQLAGFLGIFFGFVDAMDLVCSVFLFSWLLKRFGIIPSLFVLPTVGILISIPIIVLNHIPFLLPMVFWIIVSLKLAEESLRTSLTEISNLLLLQPFPLKTRAYVQSKLDSIVMGFATAVISILLIIISETIGTKIWVLVLLALVFFGISLLVLLTIKKDYANSISKAIATRFFKRNIRFNISKEDLSILKKYLISPHPDEVVYALNFIEQADRKEFSKCIPLVFNSSNNSTIHMFIINKIKQYKLRNFYEIVLQFLDKDYGYLVMAEALKALAALHFLPKRERVRQLMASPSIELSSVALYIVLNSRGHVEEKEQAMTIINERALSSDPKQRASAAYIISKAPKGLGPLLEFLCKDSDRKVCEAACYSALKLKQVYLYEPIINKIGCIALNHKIIREFKRQIRCIQPLIQKNFSTLPTLTQIKILNLLSHVKTEITKPFVEKCIQHPVFSVRRAALICLSHYKLLFNKSSLKILHKQIINEVHYINTQHKYLIHIPLIEETSLLRSLLSLKQQRGLERLLLSLSLCYERECIDKVKKGLACAQEEKRGYAIELLDTLLDANLKKFISPVLINIFLTEHSTEVSLDSKAFHTVLKKNLVCLEHEELSVLTCSACLYIILKKSLPVCEQEIESLKTVNCPIIKELFNLRK